MSTPSRADTGVIRIMDENLRQGFAQVPRPVLRAKGLSLKAKAVYILLLDYAWQQGSCFPGQERLADDLDVSVDTIQRGLAELRRFKLVDWKQQGLNRPNVYYLLPLAENPHLVLGEPADPGNRNLRFPDAAGLRFQDTATSGTKNTQVKNTQVKPFEVRKGKPKKSEPTGATGDAARAPEMASAPPPTSSGPIPEDMPPAPVSGDPVPSQAITGDRSDPDPDPGYLAFRAQALKQREQVQAASEQAGRAMVGDRAHPRAVSAQEPPTRGAMPGVGSLLTPRRGRPAGSRDERDRLTAYLADFARELGDQAPLSSTVTRAINCFKRAGVPQERWADCLYQARAITQEHSGQIATQPPAGPFRPKPKMAYFFAVLADLLGLDEHKGDSPPEQEASSNTSVPPVPRTVPRSMRSSMSR